MQIGNPDYRANRCSINVPLQAGASKTSADKIRCFQAGLQKIKSQENTNLNHSQQN